MPVNIWDFKAIVFPVAPETQETSVIGSVVVTQPEGQPPLITRAVEEIEYYMQNSRGLLWTQYYVFEVKRKELEFVND